jgi:hypothetical protein
MAIKSRAKADVRTGKGKAGRRPPVRVKSGPDVPVLAVAVGAVLLALLIGLVGWIVYLNKPQSGPQAAGGIPCDHLEHSQVHYHAALQIIYHGVPTNLRDNIGIVYDSSGTTVSCYYWLHVHPTDKNVIHIESPANQTFSVGQFFDVWNTWSKQQGYGAVRLDATHVAQFTLAPEDKMVVYVDLGDGKGPQPYAGDPRGIQLKSHEVITIEITPPDVNPPPSFTFPSGL